MKTNVESTNLNELPPQTEQVLRYLQKQLSQPLSLCRGDIIDIGFKPTRTNGMHLRRATENLLAGRSGLQPYESKIMRWVDWILLPQGVLMRHGMGLGF